MNVELLNAAKKRVTNIPVLINMVSKRVRQLNNGARPYLQPTGPNEEPLDIALREIADGLIIAELSFSPTTDAE